MPDVQLALVSDNMLAATLNGALGGYWLLKAMSLAQHALFDARLATLFAAMPQEHERGLGNWHAEWVTLPELAMITMGALRQVADMVPDLEVDADRMCANLEVTHGLIMAERVMMAGRGAAVPPWFGSKALSMQSWSR